MTSSNLSLSACMKPLECGLDRSLSHGVQYAAGHHSAYGASQRFRSVTEKADRS